MQIDKHCAVGFTVLAGDCKSTVHVNSAALHRYIANCRCNGRAWLGGGLGEDNGNKTGGCHDCRKPALTVSLHRFGEVSGVEGRSKGRFDR